VVPEANDKPVVAFASRFLKEKGIEIFADVARQLLHEGVAARFVLVGSIDPGNPSSISEAQVLEWTSEGIENWGFRHDMSQVFQSCHLVCLPTYRREGIPKVLIEAAASGRPIVTFDVPGCREIVRDGVSGIVVAPKDVNALKAAVRRILEDPQLRRRMGVEGRKHMESMFSLDHVIRQTLDTYAEVSPHV
jgi:glycosyltransferase involved in cell wall biosynthesis